MIYGSPNERLFWCSGRSKSKDAARARLRELSILALFFRVTPRDKSGKGVSAHVDVIDVFVFGDTRFAWIERPVDLELVLFRKGTQVGFTLVDWTGLVRLFVGGMHAIGPGGERRDQDELDFGSRVFEIAHERVE